MDVNQVLYFFLIGLGVGAIYSLVSLSISLLFNGSGLLNFAQGDFLMVGALSTVVMLQQGVSYWPALALAVVLTTLISIALGALFSIPLRKEGYDLDLVMLGSIGVSFALANAAAALFGRATYTIPSPLADFNVTIGSLQVPAHYLALMAAAVLLYLGTRAMYGRTDLGLRLRAVSLDLEAARYSGIRIGLAMVLTWAVTGIAGGLGGVLVGSVVYVTPYVGLPLTITGLAGAMIGGLYNPLGAMLGGLVIGVAEAYAGAYLPGSLREIVAPTLIFIVLLLRPRGLITGARARTV